MRTDEGYAAYPLGINAGAVTAFSKADGFIRIDAQAERVAAGTPVEVQMLSQRLASAELVSIGSHCVGLDLLMRRLQRRA